MWWLGYKIIDSIEQCARIVCDWLFYPNKVGWARVQWSTSYWAEGLGGRQSHRDTPRRLEIHPTAQPKSQQQDEEDVPNVLIMSGTFMDIASYSHLISFSKDAIEVSSNINRIYKKKYIWQS